MDFQILNSLIKLSKGFAHRQVRDCGLNDTECMICSYIFAHEHCSQDEVAKGLSMDKTTIAKAMLGLENKGLILRTPDDKDKRRNNLSMTPDGLEKCSQILHLHDKWMSRVLEELSEEEQVQFETYCRRLIDAAKRIQNNYENGEV